jgi:hypothetical protein
MLRAVKASPDPANAPIAQRPGVCYALTAQNVKIPVVDVTHPTFAVADDPETIASLRQSAEGMRRRGSRLPRFLLRYLMRAGAKRSLLVRAMIAPTADSVLPGMSTYLMKLGPDNLVPPYDTPGDRRFAGYPGILGIRIRLQQTARLLAQALEAELTERAGMPLCLLNIGGGSAIDSLNALILLRRAAPPLLQRKVVIHILDPDAHGPLFAGRALAALSAPAAPLVGLDAQVVHTAYNWNDAAPLQELVRNLTAEGWLLAASSEGALFEYGSDAAVVANLRALHGGGNGARIVAGSVTRGDEMTRESLRFAPFKLIPRGVEVFSNLIKGSGFCVARVEESLSSDQVLLRPESPLS